MNRTMERLIWTFFIAVAFVVGVVVSPRPDIASIEKKAFMYGQFEQAIDDGSVPIDDVCDFKLRNDDVAISGYVPLPHKFMRELDTCSTTPSRGGIPHAQNY